MNEAFKKIIERLEERQNFYENRFYEMSGTDRDVEDWGSIKSYKDAIQIVKEVAEEFGNDTNVRTNDELLIHVMHGYDSLEAPTGVMCFGYYNKGKHEIYVADDIPKEQFFQTIAHEYMHYLQDIEGRDFDEEEADAFGTDINVGSNDGWIPVSERLPREKDWYQCTCVDEEIWKKPIVRDLYYYPKIKSFIDNIRYETNGLKNIEEYNWTKYVIAWQPLPEPYKPKGEE